MHEEDGYQTRRAISRRRALRGGALGVAGLAAFALACGNDDKKEQGAATTTGAATATGGQAGAATAAPSAEQPKYGGILNQRLPNDPDRMDAHQSTTYVTVWPFAAPIFNQLVQFDPDKPGDKFEDITADLATKWEQPDGQTVRFTLKPGVKFHDGGILTSEDVKAQLEWIITPPQGKVSPRRQALAAIDKIETPDATTVLIKLKRPNPSLLMNLASHYFGIGSAKDLKENGEIGPKLIGTGPFKLKAYERGNFIELAKNPEYHMQGRPYLDGMKFFMVRDYTSALTNLIGGQYHLFYESVFTPSDQERVKKESGGKFEAEAVPSTLRSPVFMNARRKPYDDVRVRQAISLAIDRDAAIKVVKEGFGRRGGYMQPGGAWAISEADLKKFDGYDKPDLTKAKQLLQAAGVTSLKAAMPTRTDFKPFAELIKDQLAKIGIDVTIDLSDTATAQPKLQNGDFDVSAWLIGLNVDDPDATFAEVSTSNAVRNWSAVKDPKIDELYDKQSVITDTAERKKAVQELEKLALEKFQIVTAFFDDLPFARAKTVRNFKFHSSLYTSRRMESVWLAG